MTASRGQVHTIMTMHPMMVVRAENRKLKDRPHWWPTVSASLVSLLMMSPVLLLS